MTPPFNHCLSLDDELMYHPLLHYGNHTDNHFVMSSLSYEQQLKEVSITDTYLRNSSGQFIPYFSLPFGGINDFNEHTTAICEKMGYRCMLLSRNRLNRIKNKKMKNEFLHIERLMLGNSVDLSPLAKAAVRSRF